MGPSYSYEERRKKREITRKEAIEYIRREEQRIKDRITFLEKEHEKQKISNNIFQSYQREILEKSRLTQENKKVYAILTWHNFYEPMESIIFVSHNKNSSTNMLNYLNNKLEDQDILNDIIESSENFAQEIEQTNVRKVTFIMTEFNLDNLETYYNKLKNNLPIKINLIYDFICIEGMINQSYNKETLSMINDKIYEDKHEILNNIRDYFNDKYII